MLVPFSELFSLVSPPLRPSRVLMVSRSCLTRGVSWLSSLSGMVLRSCSYAPVPEAYGRTLRLVVFRHLGLSAFRDGEYGRWCGDYRADPVANPSSPAA